MTRPPRDIAASVWARLLDRARERGDDFQLVLTRYLNERLLYRLSQSRYGPSFVLKGATVFSVWTGEPYRATRDVDLLGFGDPSEDRLRAVFRDVLTAEVPDDGVWFRLDSLAVGPIRADQEYGGVRLTVESGVATARVRLQVDVGFGDAITPEAVEEQLPTLLDFPPPRLRVYPRETVVAEKLEAMVTLGLLNSRMKDFYDLAVLSRTFAFDGALLQRAIRATFERRGTPLPAAPPVAFTEEFSRDPAKATQWMAFCRKTGATSAGELPAVVAEIQCFLSAPLRTASRGEEFALRWSDGGPWT